MCGEQLLGLAGHRLCSCLLFSSRPAQAPAEFCCWGMLSSSLALDKAVGTDQSGQPWQGQRWEQPSALGVAAVPRNMARLEVETWG